MINIRGSRGVVFDINDLFPEVVILLKGNPVNHLRKRRRGPGFWEVNEWLAADKWQHGGGMEVGLEEDGGIPQVVDQQP